MEHRGQFKQENPNRAQPPIILEKGYVSDGLKGKFQSWTYKNPILISAPTGSGKNHFIFHDLYEHALATGQQLVILSNRTALLTQQKRDVLKVLQNGYPYSNEQLSNMKQFCSIYINSYQGFYHDYNAHQTFYRSFATFPKGPPLGYVILDEAHFFLNDSVFNAYTQQIYSTILHIFSMWTRIYMTATPSNSFELITAYEKIQPMILSSDMHTHPPIFRSCLLAPRLFTPLSKAYMPIDPPIQQQEPTTEDNVHQNSYANRQLIEYTMTADFSRYRIHFFKNYRSLIPKMKSANKDNKWLCFINSSSQQSEMKTLLNDTDLSAREVVKFDASQKRADNATWKGLINGEQKPAVLLSTCVIDNGISIKDPALKQIVLDTTDEVQFIQMLGRRRLKPEESLDLYVRIPEKTDLVEHCRKYNDLAQDIAEYYNNPNHFLKNVWQKKKASTMNICFLDDRCTVHLNEFACLETERKHRFYANLLYKMDNSDSEVEPFVEMVLQWMNRNDDPAKVNFCDSLTQEELKTQISDQLKSYVNIEINKKIFKAILKAIGILNYEKPEEDDDFRSCRASLNRHFRAAELDFHVYENKLTVGAPPPPAPKK